MTDLPDMERLLIQAADEFDAIAQAIVDAAAERGVAGRYAGRRVHGEGSPIIRQAAARLKEQVAENETLLHAIREKDAEIAAMREALRPFAKLAERLRPDDPDSDRPALAKVIEYRAAAAALSSFPERGEGM